MSRTIIAIAMMLYIKVKFDFLMFRFIIVICNMCYLALALLKMEL